MKTKMKTHHALCGLLSGLLLLAAGTAQTHAGLFVPTAPGAQLYVGNSGNNTIETFTPGGTGSVFASSGVSNPFSLAFDSAGSLYVANYFGSAIRKFSSSGTDLGVFADSGLSSPAGLAFDSAGNLYVRNTNDGLGGNTIKKFTSGGVGSVFASTGLDQPLGLAFDSAGNLYAVNSGNNTIEKFSSAGTDLGIFATGLVSPAGLAFDSAGNLFVANYGNSTIREFSSSGTDLGVFADSSDGLNGPTFLAFAPVPEPGTALFGLACVGVSAFRRRRRA